MHETAETMTLKSNALIWIWTCQCPTVDGRSSCCIGEATEPVSQIDASICKACEPIKGWGLQWTCEEIISFLIGGQYVFVFIKFT